MLDWALCLDIGYTCVLIAVASTVLGFTFLVLTFLVLKYGVARHNKRGGEFVVSVFLVFWVCESGILALKT
jgi:hypothetical protein